MAIMIPAAAPKPDGPGKKAERAFFLALAARLSDDFIVLYDVHLLGAKADEAQIDLLIVHREYGLLVVECKGYGVRFEGDGVWVRDRDGATERLKEPPHAQAQRQVKMLVRILEERMRGAFPARPFVHGHAVAFPFARAEGDRPLGLPREILCAADDLARLDEWVERAFAYWRGGHPAPATLDPKDFERFRRQILHPAFGLNETIGAKMCAERDAIDRTTGDQLASLGGLLANWRLYVPGAAGTGKTALAIEAARSYAAAGKSVLMVCYNAGLAAHLANVATEGAGKGRIEATTFHELCHRAVVASGLRWEVPPSVLSVYGEK